jgi:DNA-binding LytR/AlgR family response regulator
VITAATMRAVIVDDEAGARWHLRALLSNCQVQTIAECDAGSQVLDAVARIRPELVCLDVRLPDLDGIEVARRLHAGLRPETYTRPVIVFTTGYADYAPAAFELDAADYLMKPLAAARVADAMRRVRARLSRLVTPVPRLFIPDGDHRAALAPEAIRFVEAQHGASLVHADDGVHPVRAPLARFEPILVPHGFLRTHRAYLVNLRRVRALVPWSRHTWSLLMDDGKETHVPVAKSRLAAFRRNVIWITETGGLPDGPGTTGEGGHRSRRQPWAGPGDR